MHKITVGHDSNSGDVIAIWYYRGDKIIKQYGKTQDGGYPMDFTHIECSMESKALSLYMILYKYLLIANVVTA